LELVLKKRPTWIAPKSSLSGVNGGERPG
jgi:hypothetical protein